MGRRRPRRTFRKRKLRRLRKNLVHNYIRTVETIYTVYYGGALSNADVFALSQTPNFGEFSLLYDQYRITGVKRTFIYSATGADASGTLGVGGQIGTYGPAGAPMLYSIRDYDDNLPTATSEMLQRPYVSIRRITGIYKTFLRPKPLMALNAQGVIVGNGKGWIDISNASVNHYGHKWNLVPQGGPQGATSTTVLGTLRVLDRYYLQLKNPR